MGVSGGCASTSVVVAERGVHVGDTEVVLNGREVVYGALISHE
jgi:hypothetical protein